tara:strand:- start:195 stop:410 length:216 start_codon:yes stop_codon:yes gene_type:complete
MDDKEQDWIASPLHYKRRKMKEWFKTLTTKELRTWLKNFDQPNSLNGYFLGGPNKEHIEMARAEFNSRGLF